MPYNKFKLKDLETNLHLNAVQKAWLPKQFVQFASDEWLENSLHYAQTEALNSEKARSEFIIAPVLQAFRRRNIEKLSIFSGYEFNVDKSLNLLGFCDFIITLSVQKRTIEAPAFLVVETKKLDIDDNAIAQCGAEMYAAQLFNEREGKPQKAVYGCVTSAFSWCFLKLENQTLSIDPNYVPLTFQYPYNVLNTLQWILEQT
jgi:hypothetical protein